MNAQPHNETALVAPRERRAAKRSELRLRADVTLPGDLTLEAHTIDISLSGLSCRVPYALESGQTCTVELDLKRFGSGRVEVQTIVRGCRAIPDGKYQAGLEYVNVPDNVTELLRSLLR